MNAIYLQNHFKICINTNRKHKRSSKLNKKKTFVKFFEMLLEKNIYIWRS